MVAISIRELFGEDQHSWHAHRDGRVLPDFAIIGAPKCGTTSMANWLGEHPKIFMSPVKEPEYFVSDFPWGRFATTEANYRRLFKKAKPDQLCGEATSRYLFSEVAIPELLAVNPIVKLIVMVRNPIDMAPSLHSQNLWNRRETRQDFAYAWRRGPHRERWRDYRRLCALGEQVERLSHLIDRDQMHVIVADDPDRDKYESTLRFLGVESDGRTVFPRANERRTRCWDSPDRLLREPPPGLKQLKRAALYLVPHAAKRLRRGIDDLISKPTPRKSLSPELRSEMTEFFRDDVNLLSRLINRDLSHWLT